MSLYRVILVDDEEEIREGIIQKIDWEAIGYTVVGDAENGVDALEMAGHLHPDVVMTDIKMPFMDGLELCNRLSESLPSTKLIIFSGFDDFEYAQKAIKLNVAEYILKPVNSAELTETLKKLKVQMDEENHERRNVERLRKHYQESLPVMREQFLVGVIEGRIPQSRLEAQAPLFDIDLSGGPWAVALVHAVAGPGEGSAASLNGEEELIPFSLKYTVEEILGKYCKFVDFLYSDCVTVIVPLAEGEEILPLIKGMNEICKTAERALGVKISAGISTVCSNLVDIRHSYREAQNALDYSAVQGSSKAIYIADVEHEPAVKVHFDEHDEREITNAIKLGSEEEVLGIVNHMFSCFESRMLPLNQYQLYLMEMMTSLIKVMRSYDLNTDEVFGEYFNYANTIASLHSPAEMKQWCLDICLKISDMIKRERIDSTKLLAQNAKQYIEENYADSDLSVERLCSYLHVSPAYFSTVFKRETGMSFVAYLTEVRLQHALNLLNTTTDKTYMIATAVGYTEPNYFSYVFKKKFGVSPSKYRSHA